MTIKQLKDGIDRAIAEGIPEEAILEEISAIRYIDENACAEITTINLRFRKTRNNYKTTIGWNSSKERIDQLTGGSTAK